MQEIDERNVKVMNELERLRECIDKTDRELLPLFLERMGYTARVAEYKRDCGMPVLDRKRETELLADKAALAGEENAAAARAFFSAVMAISRADQNRRLFSEETAADMLCGFEKAELKKSPTVAYQGIAGAYSETALMKIFGESCGRKSVMTFAEVLEAVDKGEADYGILPLENSYTGSISDVYDLLTENSFFIVGETDVRIEHCLVGQKNAALDDIRTVYSHEQGYMQCKSFFDSHPKAEFRPYYNTALSAKLAAGSGDKSVAAIADRRCAEIYGLTVLADNISKSETNTTRFAAVSKHGLLNGSCGKISIMFALPNESGALSRVLNEIADNGLNMVKIESRPRHDKNFEYMFFVDCEGNLLDEKICRAMCDIRGGATYFRLLGNYREFV